MSEPRRFSANIVIAFVAVIGLTGTAVHYVAAQTGDVRLQGVELKGVTGDVRLQGIELKGVAAQVESLSTQVPFIAQETKLIWEEIQSINNTMVTKSQFNSRFEALEGIVITRDELDEEFSDLEAFIIARDEEILRQILQAIKNAMPEP